MMASVASIFVAISEHPVVLLRSNFRFSVLFRILLDLVVVVVVVVNVVVVIVVVVVKVCVGVGDSRLYSSDPSSSPSRSCFLKLGTKTNFNAYLEESCR